jgi:1-aminocyclopropane-1-carboxylate deaminase/D-cysteine desulfhydrase-like pyridoxal-dependent ACC family enzyme
MGVDIVVSSVRLGVVSVLVAGTVALVAEGVAATPVDVAVLGVDVEELELEELRPSALAATEVETFDVVCAAAENPTASIQAKIMARPRGAPFAI